MMTIYGRKIENDDMNNISSYMNDDIREELNTKLAPCTNELFINEYLKMDPDFIDILTSEFEFKA